MKKKELTYEQAVARLEQLAQQLEDGEMGIDVLAERLKEAQGLLKTCRQKLFATDEEIRAILDDTEK